MGSAREPRLAELLASLSLACDLGNDFTLEKGLRNCVLAMGLGRELGLGTAELQDLYYVSLLRFAGCGGYAHEWARIAGDDNAVRGAFAPVDFARGSQVLGTTVRVIGAGKNPIARAAALARFLSNAPRAGKEMVDADCDVTAHASTRLGLPEGVRRGLGAVFERWDGRGNPAQLRGEDIPVAARVLQVAHVAELFHALGGVEHARAALRRSAGGWLDPNAATAFVDRADELCSSVDGPSVWEAVLALEPAPVRFVAASSLDRVVETFGQLADVKSPFRLGHSARVAAIAEKAARELGLPEDAAADVRRAAHLHDLGCLSVPSSIWDKPGPLGRAEWERVRLHAYHTERVLAPSPTFAPLARLAGAHHERCDGTGYHRGTAASGLDARIHALAAADVYCALTEERPHRPALPPAEAARELDAIASRGSLDRDAVAAVCAVAGHAVKPRPTEWPNGLSDREVDVLRLLARGLSKKEIAAKLFIATGTVHTHVVHIYDKVGVRSRAGVAMFAMTHGIVRD